MKKEKYSIRILERAAELQRSKGNDYQNPNSRIRQADYYPSGVKTILEIIHAKVLRATSVVEAMEHDSKYQPNHESVLDSMIDLINYASFAAAYVAGEIDGQDGSRDILNRKK